jgi:hypothetical protein
MSIVVGKEHASEGEEEGFVDNVEAWGGVGW